jgi:5,10-methylenetetrahydromethanopterin reductase
VISLTNIIILSRGESVTSERVIEENGPYVISSLHYLFDKVRQYGGGPPQHLQGIWEDYSKLIESTSDERTRHLRIHDGHCTFLREDERPYVTEELIRATCIVGSPDEIVSTLSSLEEAGLTEIMMMPAPGAQVRVAEQVADQIFPRLPA